MGWGPGERLRVVELFAGGGGSAQGLREAGDVEHVALYEVDKYCVATLRANGFDTTHQVDVREVDFAECGGCDLLVAGVPCQPFSAANARAAGEQDRRNGWPHALRALRELQPACFVFENVAGLLRDSFRDFFGRILAEIEAAGYVVHTRLLRAVEHGMAQTRRRVFLVGFRDAAAADRFQWPAPEPGPPTVRSVVGNLGPPLADDDGALRHFFHAGARQYRGHNPSRPDGPARTVLAGTSGCDGGNNTYLPPDGELRYFTVREVARLQTFPDSYRFPGSWTQAFKQIGNAVPPRLMRLLAAQLREAMRHQKKRCV